MPIKGLNQSSALIRPLNLLKKTKNGGLKQKRGASSSESWLRIHESAPFYSFSLFVFSMIFIFLFAPLLSLIPKKTDEKTVLRPIVFCGARVSADWRAPQFCDSVAAASESLHLAFRVKAGPVERPHLFVKHLRTLELLKCLTMDNIICLVLSTVCFSHQ